MALSPPIQYLPAAVRDTLGLVRLLWRLGNEGIDFDRRTELAKIGEALSDTLPLGCGRPDTVGYRAAIIRADEAVDRLAALGWSGETAELVRVAQARVRGGREPPRSLGERCARK